MHDLRLLVVPSQNELLPAPYHGKGIYAHTTHVGPPHSQSITPTNSGTLNCMLFFHVGVAIICLCGCHVSMSHPDDNCASLLTGSDDLVKLHPLIAAIEHHGFVVIVVFLGSSGLDQICLDEIDVL